MKKESRKFNNNKEIMTAISSLPTGGLPNDCLEIVDNYGTYEIQATADTDNQYPAIAQGFNKKIIKNDCEHKDTEDNHEFKELRNGR